MTLASAFAAGLVFGVGLLVSGMTDPGKVIGFLDVAGNWDPSLAFVMAGAIAVAFVAFAAAERRGKAFLGGTLRLPRRRDIDRRLVGWSVLFGIGWGLAGFCPGPALVAFAAGVEEAGVFAAAMLAGMAVQAVAERLVQRTGRTAR